MSRFFFIIIIPAMLFACNPYENPLTKNSEKKEILVYSGITMADAVLELSNIFEKETGCRVSVMYGASGYLRSVIEVNKAGDIYFPGDASYLNELKDEKVITRVEDMGFNRLSFFVEKNNPLRLTGDINQLKDKSLRVIIGAQSGSVGNATVALLKKHGIYDEAAANAVSFAADSRGLAEALRNKKADITVNWYATGFFVRNAPMMDAIRIDSPYVDNVPISMGMLRYSVDTECAEKFLDMAASDTGQKIFRKYGFKD